MGDIETTRRTSPAATTACVRSGDNVTEEYGWGDLGGRAATTGLLELLPSSSSLVALGAVAVANCCSKGWLCRSLDVMVMARQNEHLLQRCVQHPEPRKLQTRRLYARNRKSGEVNKQAMADLDEAPAAFEHVVASHMTYACT